MRVKLVRLAIISVCVAFVCVGVSNAQNLATKKPSIETIQVSENIYMLRGKGGNVGVLKGTQRTIIIDGQFARAFNDIAAAIKVITPHPVTHLINTHYHSDHTSANEKWLEQGATIIAHINTRNALSAEISATEPNPRLPMLPVNALPFITFTEQLTLHEGSENIEIVHFPKAHTQGDIAVFFPKSNVIVTGDLYFVGVTPFIDTQSGGTYQGYLLAMKSILDRADQDTKIIPGHGPLTNKSTMQRDYESLQEFDPTSLD